MQIPGEDVRGDCRSPRGYLRQLVCGFVVAPSDVVELEPEELVFQAPNLVTVVTPRILQLNFFFSLLAKIRALPFFFFFPR